MLKSIRNVEINGESIFDGVSAAGYNAKINSNNPEDITLTNWTNDKTAYKNNRAQCYKDREEFENAAYALQAEMIAEKAAATE